MVLSGANAAIFVAELENPYPTPSMQIWGMRRKNLKILLNPY